MQKENRNNRVHTGEQSGKKQRDLGNQKKMDIDM